MISPPYSCYGVMVWMHVSSPPFNLILFLFSVSNRETISVDILDSHVYAWPYKNLLILTMPFVEYP